MEKGKKQTTVRLPTELYRKLIQERNRSLNTQIVEHIQHSFEKNNQTEKIAEIGRDLKQIKKYLIEVDRTVREISDKTGMKINLNQKYLDIAADKKLFKWL
jgi:hypothetical protein